ncbi:MAG: glycoside hydrolase family 13 protein [Clostridia bacterium]|nr:glycoside hydrolase family 13 protein [Clostridia bacterium]
MPNVNVFSIYTDEVRFVSPFMPKRGDEVTFLLKAYSNDFIGAKLVVFEEFTWDENGEQKSRVEKHVIEMHLDEELSEKKQSIGYPGNFDYYSAKFVVNNRCFYHYELIDINNETVYYNWKSWGRTKEEERGIFYQYDFRYNFVIVPDMVIPKWTFTSLNYQVYIDRFCNGDTSNDVVDNEWMNKTCEYERHATPREKEYVYSAKEWNDFPDVYDVNKFYNGDLQGLIDKLDYLKELGVGCLYLNPIFLSPSNHRYNVQNYEYIDPHIGKIVVDADGVLDDDSISNYESTKYTTRITKKENLEASNKLFIKLVKEAHKRGIKVILDGVFNHCSSYHPWLDRGSFYANAEGVEKGAYINQNSPYHDYFLFHQSKMKYNDSYDKWAGFETLPKLYYEGSKELEDYIMMIAAKWVSPPYNADGWRCDVAADIGCSRKYNHYFWKRFRQVVKEANPNAIIIAEYYEDPTDYLKGDEWDSIMGYRSFMEQVGYFFTGMDKHCNFDKNEELYGNASVLMDTMRWELSRMPMQSILCAFNQISNHDHARFLTRTKGEKGRIEDHGSSSANLGINPGIYKEATVFMYTWFGMPTIYYGDEVGLAGWTDPDNRRPYPWGREDKEFFCFHKDLKDTCNKYPSLKFGSLRPLKIEENLLAYAKIADSEIAIVIFNNRDNKFVESISVDVWQLGIIDGTKMKTVFRSNVASSVTTEKEVNVFNGQININLVAFATAIVVYKFEPR